MIVSGCMYVQYICQLLYLNTNLLYVSAVIFGLGAPVLWTAQGTFLSMNSDEDTISRNSGIFWAMMQMSTFIGNTFAYFMFSGEEFISSDTRTIVGAVLLSISLGGVLTLFLLKPVSNVNESKKTINPISALREAGAFFITKEMLLLSITFVYNGLQLSFWSVVYPTSVGFTNNFGQNRLIQ